MRTVIVWRQTAWSTLRL